MNAYLDSPRAWVLYVVAAAGTSLWSLGSPALRALMPGLVPPEQLAASQALQSVYSSTGAIAGPALGGLLISAVGVGSTYAIGAATFGGSLLAVLLIAPAPPTGVVDRQLLESLRAGWRFLRRQRVILGTFVLDTNAMVFGMPMALFQAIAGDHFDGGAEVVGVLYAALSAGALGRGAHVGLDRPGRIADEPALLGRLGRRRVHRRCGGDPGGNPQPGPLRLVTGARHRCGIVTDQRETAS